MCIRDRVGDPPNLMIGSAADISFNTFAIAMGPPVLVVWLVVLIYLKFAFKKELAQIPAEGVIEEAEITQKKLWRNSLIILGLMTVLFIAHNTLHWDPWFVAALGMTLLALSSRGLLMDDAVEHVEIPLLIFFIGLFMVVGLSLIHI